MPSLSAMRGIQDDNYFKPLSQEQRTERAAPKPFVGFDYGLGDGNAKPITGIFDNTATRYVFTYVNDIGEESAPKELSVPTPPPPTLFDDNAKPITGIFDNICSGWREEWRDGRLVKQMISRVGLQTPECKALKFGFFSDLPCPF